MFQRVRLSSGVCLRVRARTGMHVGPGTAASHDRATREPRMRVDVTLRNLTGALET